MTKICGHCGTESEFTKEDAENGLQCRCGAVIEWNPEWEDQGPMPPSGVPLSAMPDSLSDAKIEGQKPSTVPNMIEIEPGIWVEEKEWTTCHWPEDFAEVSRYVRVDGMYVLQSEMEVFWAQAGE